MESVNKGWLAKLKRLLHFSDKAEETEKKTEKEELVHEYPKSGDWWFEKTVEERRARLKRSYDYYYNLAGLSSYGKEQILKLMTLEEWNKGVEEDFGPNHDINKNPYIL